MASLPDALKLTPMSTVDTMTIDTNVLDPITISQTQAKFVLENKGILDVGSTFTFSVHPVQAGDDKCFLPIKTGIHSLIQRAVLKVGTKVLAQSDDYSYYATMKRAHKTNEEKSQKDFVLVGSTDVLQPDNQGTGQYQLQDVNYSTAGVSTIDPSVRLRTSQTDCPIFSIKLSDLFPMMRSVQLPLFLMSEPVSVELTFRKQVNSNASVGTIAVFENGYAGDVSISVGTANCKFLADYLSYTDDRMEETARIVNSEDGLVMPYENLILTNTTIPAVAPAPPIGAPVKQAITREIGLSGQNVRSLLIHDKAVLASYVDQLIGQYMSTAYVVSDAYNFRINDQLVYSRDIVNEARKAEQLSKVFGTMINCLNAEYSFDALTNKQNPDHPVTNNSVSTNTVDGIPMRQVQGQSHYEGLDLSLTPANVFGAGTTIGLKPMTMSKTVTRTNGENASRELRIFATVEQAFSLRRGIVSVA